MEFENQLIATYKKAPINSYYKPQLTFEEEGAVIKQEIRACDCHAGKTSHGAVLFKLLDDTAFFTAQRFEKTFLLTTVQFDIRFARHALPGQYTAYGTLELASKKVIHASAIVKNDKGKVIARGNGIFMRSSVELSSC